MAMNIPQSIGQVTIRAATMADAKRLAELSGQLGYPATPEEISRRLSKILGNEEHSLLVAETPGARVIAWVHVHLIYPLEEEPQAEIGGLVVDHAYRARGMGQALMQQAEQWAREKGCRALRLRSNVIRTGAHAFYERLGYQMVKTQKVFRKTL